MSFTVETRRRRRAPPASLGRTDWPFTLYLWGKPVARAPDLALARAKAALFDGPAFVLDTATGTVWLRALPGGPGPADPHGFEWTPIADPADRPAAVRRALAHAPPPGVGRPKRMPPGARLPYRDD